MRKKINKKITKNEAHIKFSPNLYIFSQSMLHMPSPLAYSFCSKNYIKVLLSSPRFYARRKWKGFFSCFYVNIHKFSIFSINPGFATLLFNYLKFSEAFNHWIIWVLQLVKLFLMTIVFRNLSLTQSQLLKSFIGYLKVAYNKL